VTISWIKPESSGSPNLLSSRDALSTGHCDERTAAAITSILAGPDQGQNDAAGTLEKLQVLLEQIRRTPKGIARVSRMNAFVRTLGRADNLASFLELMRTSLKSSRLSDHKIAERSRAGLTHCLYGWAGQSHVLYSERNPLPATTLAGNGVENHMGYPVAEWHASIHIWQPNPEAQAFKSLKRFEPGVLVEPPHSHPFSFVSYVSIGMMRESVYQEASASAPTGSAGRYQDVYLERVDGVWPPHREYARRRLRTIEDRIDLLQGQSYFMSPDMIHDVEVDRATSADQPAITFFLCSETTRVPNSYMVPSMAEFHRGHPDLTRQGKPLDLEAWDAKLDATARYLRGETDYLRLGEIVKCDSSYAFMNQ
jgi:hypothetical protein